MYSRSTDRVEGHDEAIELLAAAPFVHLVTTDGETGFAATSLPMLVDGDRLIGHVARANPHWRHLAGRPALVIAVPGDGYVSPSWYPSKDDNGGRVVPTWNYEALHVHGTADVHEDAGWLFDLVRRLTDLHEGRRSDGGERWTVDDAPPDFIEGQLRAIVGVSVSIDRIDAKRKLSGNRSAEDQRGVLAGLRRTSGASARLMQSMDAATDSIER